jgi:succinate dehydrogenase/fumarate reductase flavoprotein subunit
MHRPPGKRGAADMAPPHRYAQPRFRPTHPQLRVKRRLLRLATLTMLKGRLYDREGIATVEGRTRDTLGRKFLVVYLCALAISNRRLKDSSCTHKGLVTNWPHTLEPGEKILCPSIRVNPIDTPPYYGYPVTENLTSTYGGAKTNTDARVLSTNDIPIPGLYAAGELTGLSYHEYPPATSVLRSLTFGRITRTAIAKMV